MERGRIFIISGLSGAGKSAVVKYILSHRKDTVKAVSYTTREERSDEVDGKDYFFIDKNHFLKKIEDGFFLEFGEVYGHLYGTGLDSFKPVEEGKDVIKGIDVQGALKLKKMGIKAFFIFLKAPKAVIRRRLQKRGEAEIKIRMHEESHELKESKNFDVVIDTSGTEKGIPKNAEKVMKAME